MSNTLRRRKGSRHDRKQTCRKKSLRLEPLEPRLTLSAGPLLHWAGAIGVGAPSHARNVQSQCLSVADNADTYVEGGAYSNTNFGNSSVLLVRGDANPSNVARTYMRFDLSNIGGTISSAVLEFVPVGMGSSLLSTGFRLRMLPDSSDGWVEGNGTAGSGMTWNNAPSSVGNAIVFSGSYFAANVPNMIDVTAMVKQSFNQNRIVTLELDVVSWSGSQSYVQLASRESGMHPTLMVTSTAPAVPPPTVATAAAAAPTAVTGTTAGLSVLGADAAGEGSLTYTWSATTLPNGAATPAFSANGSNAAKGTTVTFAQAGTYGLTVKIADPYGLFTTSTVNVTVSQTLSRIVVTPGNVSLSAGTTQQFAAVGLDQFGRPLSGLPGVTWHCNAGTISPQGLFTAPAAAGPATVSAVCGALGGNSAVTVIPPPPTVATAASAGSTPVTGTTAGLSVLGADAAGEGSLTYTWSATTLPGGAAAPLFAANASNAAKNTIVTFAAAGTYGLTVKIADSYGLFTTSTVNVTVSQTLTQIMVTPGNVSLPVGARQQFAAVGLDQFGRPLAAAPGATWTATAGAITPGGLFTAPAAAGSVTIAAAAGSLHASATANITPGNFLGLKDPALAALTENLLSHDGAINRADMIAILQSVARENSTVSSNDFSDLKTILSDAATLKIPGYVQVLGGDVVNGNAANLHYQGQALGNLAAGSPASRLSELLSKWFLGSDHPLAGGYTYHMTAGTLFGNGPAYTDAYQGYLGDCYFISSLGSIAESSPAAIQNMFIANGDNTWTVRFYFNGTADYVTVDNQFPTDSSGNLVYADCGFNDASTAKKLWIPLAEKAYAQWNETGREGRNGQNDYAAIEGGLMDAVDAQVLGHSASDYYYQSNSEQQVLIAALAAHKAVTTGTDSNPGYGLYGDHAYAVVGYNSANATFTLYNPWGCDQPDPLTWNELASNTFMFTVADPSGSVPAGVATSPSALADLLPLHKLSLAAIDQLMRQQ